MIGHTTVDLEDRWFDARWQKMGEENVLMPGADPNDPTKVSVLVFVLKLFPAYCEAGKNIFDIRLNILIIFKKPFYLSHYFITQ